MSCYVRDANTFDVELDDYVLSVRCEIIRLFAHRPNNRQQSTKPTGERDSKNNRNSNSADENILYRDR